jgi:hypothetical protein
VVSTGKPSVSLRDGLGHHVRLVGFSLKIFNSAEKVQDFQRNRRILTVFSAPGGFG